MLSKIVVLTSIIVIIVQVSFSLHPCQDLLSFAFWQIAIAIYHILRECLYFSICQNTCLPNTVF